MDLAAFQVAVVRQLAKELGFQAPCRLAEDVPWAWVRVLQTQVVVSGYPSKTFEVVEEVAGTLLETLELVELAVIG